MKLLILFCFLSLILSNPLLYPPINQANVSYVQMQTGGDLSAYSRPINNSLPTHPSNVGGYGYDYINGFPGTIGYDFAYPARKAAEPIFVTNDQLKMFSAANIKTIDQFLKPAMKMRKTSEQYKKMKEDYELAVLHEELVKSYNDNN